MNVNDAVRLVNSQSVDNNSFLFYNHNNKQTSTNTMSNLTEQQYSNSDILKAILKKGTTVEYYYNSIMLATDAEIKDEETKHEFLTSNACLQELRRIILHLHAIGHKNFRAVMDEFREGKYDHHDVIQRAQYTAKQVDMLKKVSHRVSYKQFTCLDCLRTKLKAHPRKKVGAHTTLSSPMATGHVDVFGPFLVPLHGKKRYVYVYICDDSSYMMDEWSTHHDSDQAGAAVQAWRCTANGAGWSMHKQHFDADAVFKAKEFQEVLHSMDIGTQYAPPGQHWVNGLIERFGQTISNNSMAMLRASGLPIKYYPFAFSYAIFLHNHLYIIPKTVGRNPEYWGKTPNDIIGLPYQGVTPAFGQAVMSRHSDPDSLGKLDDVGRLCAFLNIDQKSHNAKIMLHIKTGVVITSADIHIIDNLYAWTMTPIVQDNNLHVMGHDINLPREPDNSSTSENIKDMVQEAGIKLSPLPMPISKKARIEIDQQDNDNNRYNKSVSTNNYMRSLVPGTDLPIRPDDIMAACALTIATYYNNVEIATNKAMLLTPHIRKDTGLVINKQITSAYFTVNYCSVPSLIQCQYERGLSMDEVDQIISDARNHAANVLACEAYAVQPSGRHKAKLIDFGSGPTLVRIPTTLKQALQETPAALSSPSSPSMKDIFYPAWQREIASFVKHGSLGPPVSVLPEGMVPVKMKFIFDIKTSASQQYLKGKVRLVTKGFMTKYMIHYQETYSPTAHMESTKFVIYLIAVCNFHPFTIDIEVAFLNDPAITRVFFEDMPGLPDYDESKTQWREGLTNIYGNKDAGRLFWRNFVPRVKAAAYQSSINDCCLLWKRSSTGLLTVLVLHVDNVTGASEDPTELARLKASLQKHYTVTYENNIDQVLGMTIHKNSNGVTVIFPDGYYNDVAEQLGLTNLQPAKTMGDPAIRFQPNTTGKATPAMISMYRKLIGSLLFPSRWARPDQYNRVRDLAAFTSNPSFEHMDAAIRILRRGISTNRYGLAFSKPDFPIPKPLKFEIVGWSDADWCKEFDWKSVSGAVMRICFPSEIQYAVSTKDYTKLKHNCLSYQSRKQSDHVADSSMMSETVGGCVLMRGIMWLRDLLKETDLLADNSKGIMFNDNKGLIINLHNFRITTKMRHYARSIAFLIHEVENNRINPLWIPAISNVANQLTKNLSQTETDKQSQWLMAMAEWFL
jgi:hypothetical protein